MSDETPTIPPPAETPPASETPTPAAPPVEDVPKPQRGDRPPRPKRPFQPKPASRVPTLENTDDLSHRAPNLRELDAQVEDEFAAAMAGFDEQKLLTADTAASNKDSAPAAQPGRKRGRVISIHGDDVFVEIPGGRSQGVLSLEQFENVAPRSEPRSMSKSTITTEPTDC